MINDFVVELRSTINMDESWATSDPVVMSNSSRTLGRQVVVIDVVDSIAALVHVSVFMTSPMVYYKVNAGGSRRIELSIVKIAFNKQGFISSTIKSLLALLYWNPS